MNTVKSVCSSAANVFIIRRFAFKLTVVKEDNKKKLKRFNFENQYLFGNIVNTEIKSDGTNPSESLEKVYLESSKLKSNIKVFKRNVVKREPNISPLADDVNESDVGSNPTESLEKRYLENSKLKSNIKVFKRNVVNHVPNISPLPDDVKECNGVYQLSQTGNICSFPLYNVLKPNYVETSSSEITCTSVKNKNTVSYPSVTVILRETMSETAKFILEQWKRRMILELGEEGFQEYSKNLLLHGRMMHELIKNHFLGISEEQLTITRDLEGCWKSLQSVLPLFKNALFLERPVVHPELKYKGILDCVAHFGGKPIIIDWKKSDKQKSSIQMTYDAPIQISAYLGALNFDDNYPFKVDEGLIVVVYTTGSKADVFPLNRVDCDKYWKQWLTRLDQYFQLEKARQVL